MKAKRPYWNVSRAHRDRDESRPAVHLTGRIDGANRACAAAVQGGHPNRTYLLTLGEHANLRKNHPANCYNSRIWDAEYQVTQTPSAANRRAGTYRAPRARTRRSSELRLHHGLCYGEAACTPSPWCSGAKSALPIYRSMIENHWGDA